MEWAGTPWMDKLVSPQGYDNPTDTVFLISYKSRNDAILRSAGASSLKLMDDSGNKVDNILPLL